MKILAGHCAAIGRDPAEIERSVLIGGNPYDVGPELLDLGVTLFTIGANASDHDFTELREWIAWRDSITPSRRSGR